MLASFQQSPRPRCSPSAVLPSPCYPRGQPLPPPVLHPLCSRPQLPLHALNKLPFCITLLFYLVAMYRRDDVPDAVSWYIFVISNSILMLLSAVPVGVNSIWSFVFAFRRIRIAVAPVFRMVISSYVPPRLISASASETATFCAAVYSVWFRRSSVGKGFSNVIALTPSSLIMFSRYVFSVRKNSPFALTAL